MDILVSSAGSANREDEVGAPKYMKLERIWLKNHPDPDLNERWVQQRIAEDRSVLGLGDLILRDKERAQPRAGRLDLLLEDADTNRRYEVEVQLGETDETHIIRTLEYWDIERKRYPQYDHCAVLVAEDITSRFLNVIGLFNGAIPLIAIQMQAVKIGDQIGLVFTTVLDELVRGFEEEDEDETPVDREYWEARGSEATVAMVDELLAVVRELDPRFDLKYNKYFIGLARGGQPYNFATFVPTRKAVRLAFRLTRSEDVDSKIKDSGLETLRGSLGWYCLRIGPEDLTKNREVLRDLLRVSYESWKR